MKNRALIAAWLASVCCLSPIHAQAQSAAIDLDFDPFLGRPTVFPLIHADSAARFEAANPANKHWGSGRIATVQVAPQLRIRLEAQEEPSFPSWVRLVDAKTGAPLKDIAVYGLDEAVWYFPGNGNIYLRQREISLCGPRILRKFEVKGQAIQEVTQPIHFIGAESKVALDAITIYASPEKGAVVAVAPKGSTVFVIGALPAKTFPDHVPLLVRTSLGLTGWHFQGEGGQLEIHQCN
ncbi:hypothetical protein ACS5PN_10430 [Roseateles sp. NT4]|uniref:hypothetical protein n=1 Tax=Roseateles sp. NT4 TaxID=3453715 RepID=UPI003EEA5065